MPEPNLPVNIDSTYADSGTDASVKLHQQYHDTIHGVVKEFDTGIGTANANDVLAFNSTSPGLYVPTALWAILPAGFTLTLTKSGGTWPGVPTTRADIVIFWKGPDPSPPNVSSRTLGQAGVLNNVDARLITT
jgi:hypothetical protein